MSDRRIRADLLLVERGFFDSRSRARAAIEAGLVTANGASVAKPSDMLPFDAEMTAEAPHPWVSRGGLKLVAALDTFGIDPRGLDCLDVGASTGGFTDVLLARGAASVTAIDVGHGQLHPRLAADPRVSSHEGADARGLAGIVRDASVDLATVDVSFISLRLVLPALLPLLRDRSWLVALVKPQFEVGRAGIGRGGIVRDDALRQASLDGIVDIVTSLGLEVMGSVPSPIVGGDGNIEYLLGARRG